MRTNEEIVDLLAQLKDEKGLSISELARRVGMAKSALSRYFNRTREFPLNKVNEFANALGVSPEYILGFDEETSAIDNFIDMYNQLNEKRQNKVYKFAEQQLEEQNKKVAFNVYGQVAAGPALEYDDSEVETHYVESVPATADMALTINGNSMEPSFPNGSIVFYKRQPQVEHGEIAIVEIDGNAVTCKKVCYDYDNKKIILQSLNDKYEDMVFEDDQIRILGKVVK